ncbi:MAG: metallo-mystery pair system four-Cys motif protein, partial [Woeseiaceae bacterium]|nr:metallo-mystery pair system four-Cys motif protein [Woeseiaceae bacterium]
CSPKRVPVQLEFLPTWHGQPLQCDDADTRLTDLRFFVSEVSFIDSTGLQHELAITTDDRWQQEGVALIDLENGEMACLNGSRDVNFSVSGAVKSAEIVGLRFTIGVPFDLNHADPLTAQAPLNDPSMHWHWRSGYKFLRAGVATATDSFWIHLGSTGCEGTVRNITGCRFPNRVLVEFSEFSPNVDQVEIDLSALFRDVDLDDSVRDDCSSGPAESSCTEPFAALGLKFNDSTVRTPQRVFRVRP